MKNFIIFILASIIVSAGWTTFFGLLYFFGQWVQREGKKINEEGNDNQAHE